MKKEINCDTRNLRESEIEKALCRAVRKTNGISPKFVSPGMAGMPDRLVLLEDGRMAFVELKAPGKRMRPLQEKRKRQLESLGYKVFCIDKVDQIEEVINAIKGGDAE